MNPEPSTYAAAVFQREMQRWGITPARLRRHCWQRERIPARRVAEVLRGVPGYLGSWSQGALSDWLEIIRAAWQTD